MSGNCKASKASTLPAPHHNLPTWIMSACQATPPALLKGGPSSTASLSVGTTRVPPPPCTTALRKRGGQLKWFLE